jgi:propanol-preferring alcohol dehydrogenase
VRAARLHGYGKPFRIEDVPIPKPGPGEVLLRVGGAGFCHSDVHIATGELQILPKFPVTLGHENAGVVAACGPGVSSVREGDPALVYGGWGCGRCALCIAGTEQLCEKPEWPGIFEHDGGYAEFMLVPHDRYLVKLDRLTPREAAPLADAALTPYRAVRLALPYLEPDHFALTIGVGGLGAYGLKLLRTLSGCPLIAVDISERKRRLALELGATHALDGRAKDLAKQVLDITQGHGVCAAFDFVGSNETLALAVGTTRSRGKVTQIGLGGGTASLEVLKNSRFEVAFEASLWGSLKELREVVALAESGRLGNIPLEYAPLEAINDVLARVQRGEVEGRIVITPNA